MVTMSETNTFFSTNNVTSSWWATNHTSIPLPLPGGEPFPTDLYLTPMALAIYSGYYVPDNVSSAQALVTIPRVTASLPLSVGYFVFQPLSDNATAFEYWQPSGNKTWEPYGDNWTAPVAGSFSLQGTYLDYNYPPSQVQKFAPGFYTIAGGDEWGQLVLLYFVVK